jgi:hypothetical protein
MRRAKSQGADGAAPPTRIKWRVRPGPDFVEDLTCGKFFAAETQLGPTFTAVLPCYLLAARPSVAPYLTFEAHSQDV